MNIRGTIRESRTFRKKLANYRILMYRNRKKVSCVAYRYYHLHGKDIRLEFRTVEYLWGSPRYVPAWHFTNYDESKAAGEPC